MKKLLFVTLLIGCVGLVYGQHKEKDIDCHNFYKENFDTLSVKGIIWEKGIIDDNYFLSVKNDQGEIIVIKLSYFVKKFLLLRTLWCPWRDLI